MRVCKVSYAGPMNLIDWIGILRRNPRGAQWKNFTEGVRVCGVGSNRGECGIEGLDRRVVRRDCGCSRPRVNGSEALVNILEGKDWTLIS
jgi:hypothetical protein